MDHSPTFVLQEDERRRIVVGVLIAMLLAALDQTVVAPAVPTIGAALGDVAYLPWIVSAYFLTGTAVTPLYGKLADIHGRRPVLFAAIAIFTLGSIACALAPTMLVLVLGRAVQGLGGGGLMALAQTVIGDIVPPRERGRYMIYISTIWATASIAGPIVGGFFAEHLHWSLIFWINLPLAAFAVLMTNSSLKRLPQRLRAHRLDFIGSALIMGAAVSAMLTMTWAGTRFAWWSPQIAALIAALVVCVAVLARHLRRTPEPLIPLAVLRNPVILSATLAVFFGMGVNVGLAVYIPLYLELAHGVDTAQAGMALVALLASSVLGANIAGRAMMTMHHYRRLAVFGVGLAALGMSALALGAGTLPFAAVEVLLFVVGGGLGSLFPITTVSVQNAVDPHDLGVATGMLAFLRSLGSALGISVLGAIVLASGVVHDLGQMSDAGHSAAGLARHVPGQVFAPLFAAGTLLLLLSLTCLLAMRELPLRGGAPVVAEP